MADFAAAYAKTMRHEGGYANNPADRGGETYKGIARKHWPGWKGWPIVDWAKSRPGFPRSLSGNSELQRMAEEFYRNAFWSNWMQAIPSQGLAEWYFDKAVNMGTPQATKLLQRAVGAVDDGKYGPKTHAAVLKALKDDEQGTIDACREQARAFYRHLADANPSQQQFLRGWLARA
jgi:lysozyme family protein